MRVPLRKESHISSYIHSSHINRQLWFLTPSQPRKSATSSCPAMAPFPAQVFLIWHCQWLDPVAASSYRKSIKQQQFAFLYLPGSPSTALIHRGAHKHSKQDLPQKKTLMHGNTENTLNIIFPLCSLTCCELLKTNLPTSKITYSVYPLLQLIGLCRLTHTSRDQLNSDENKHKYEERKGLEAQGTFFVGIICLIPQPDLPRCWHWGKLHGQDWLGFLLAKPCRAVPGPLPRERSPGSGRGRWDVQPRQGGQAAWAAMAMNHYHLKVYIYGVIRIKKNNYYKRNS